MRPGEMKQRRNLLQSFSLHPPPQAWLPLSASTWTRTSRPSSPCTAPGLDTVWSSTPTGEDRGPGGEVTGLGHLISSSPCTAFCSSPPRPEFTSSPVSLVGHSAKAMKSWTESGAARPSRWSELTNIYRALTRRQTLGHAPFMWVWFPSSIQQLLSTYCVPQEPVIHQRIKQTEIPPMQNLNCY